MSGATETPAGERKPWLHGKAVENGKVRFLSVSALEKADMSSGSGCLRRYYYQYVLGVKEPSTPAQERGTKLHAEVAKYLTTGVKALSGPAVAGLFMMPLPGDDLLVEHDLVPELLDANGKPISGLEHAPLTAAGIPLVGAIDLMHDRGENKGVSEIDDVYDDEGTVEVLDWKFPGTDKYLKKGADLIKTIQMAGYGEYVFRTVPGAKLVRLSHGYMPIKGRARKATARFDREQIARAWEHANAVAGSVIHAVRETDVNKVEANTKACHSFNKDCINKPYCTAGMHNSLSTLFGVTAGARLSAKLQAQSSATGMPPALVQISPRPPKPQGANPVSLIRKNPATTTPAAAPPAAPAPAANPGRVLINRIAAGVTASTTKPEVTIDPAEVARLEAEERAAQLAKLIPPGFAENWAKIVALGCGTPPLAGRAVIAYHALNGKVATGSVVLAGTEQLANMEQPIEDPAVLADLIAEIEEQLAMDAAEVVTPTPAEEQRDANAETLGILAPDTPDSDPTQAANSPAGTVVPTAEKPKKERAPRKPKTEPATAPATVNTQPITTGETSGHSITTADTSVSIYVDCMPLHSAQRFEPIVWNMLQLMCEEVGLNDLRAGDKDSPVGFGKWKSAIATAFRTGDVQIAPGRYLLDSRSEVMSEVAAVLAEVCAAKGYEYVRGTR